MNSCSSWQVGRTNTNLTDNGSYLYLIACLVIVALQVGEGMQPLVYLNKEFLFSWWIHQSYWSLNICHVILNVWKLSSFALRVEVHWKQSLSNFHIVDIVLLSFWSSMNIWDHYFNTLTWICCSNTFKNAWSGHNFVLDLTTWLALSTFDFDCVPHHICSEDWHKYIVNSIAVWNVLVPKALPHSVNGRKSKLQESFRSIWLEAIVLGERGKDIYSPILSCKLHEIWFWIHLKLITLYQ